MGKFGIQVKLVPSARSMLRSQLGTEYELHAFVLQRFESQKRELELQ